MATLYERTFSFKGSISDEVALNEPSLFGTFLAGNGNVAFVLVYLTFPESGLSANDEVVSWDRGTNSRDAGALSKCGHPSSASTTCDLRSDADISLFHFAITILRQIIFK